MTKRNEEFLTRDDDRELNEFLDIMHNEHMIFENCTFSLCTNKQFRNSTFINCIFDHVTRETYFTNCTFESPTFYSAFHGKFVDCNITKYSGVIGELKEKPV